MTNEFIKLIKERRSIRSYTDEKVDKELISEIIQAGRYAPSADNDQPWKFIVITKKEFIKYIASEIKSQLLSILKKKSILKYKFKELKDEKVVQLLGGAALAKIDIIFFNAPVLVFIITKDHLFYNESCSCCAQNMMLAAHSLDLGSCWIGFASVLGMRKEILKKIGVPDNYHIAAALIFGHPKEKSKKPSIRKVESDIINWIE